jgi:energy-coupling factor transport system ATP-binding protein
MNEIKAENLNAIKVDDLKFKYEEDGEYILKGISLEIKQGEYVALLGSNGSGKSTLAKLLCGLGDIEEGSIHIHGIELSNDNIDQIRQDITMVFQNPDNQFIGSTVEDDIAFGMENHCIPRDEMVKRIEEYSKAVNMYEFLGSEPQKLSGGQKQRVAIAGVLAFTPKIVIFDESTAMLDPIGKKEVGELIKKIAKENNMTIITVTHDMEEAKDASRVIVLNQGVIEMDGTPAEVFKNEGKLSSMNLDVPFATRISNRLKANGINAPLITDKEVLVSWLKK